MRKALLALGLAAFASMPAWAALPVGSRAPDSLLGRGAGKPFKLHLKEQLRHGPVVLYFFPKAFTKGCTLEAHAFSDASADFKKLGRG